MAAKEQIEKMEERLRQAMLNSDVEELNKLLSEDLIFTDHTGQKIPKEADLEAHRSGKLKIEAIGLSEEEIQIFEDTAIVSVLMESRGQLFGAPFQGKLRFTRVWRIQEDSWKIIAAHSCLFNS